MRHRSVAIRFQKSNEEEVNVDDVMRQIDDNNKTSITISAMPTIKD